MKRFLLIILAAGVVGVIIFVAWMFFTAQQPANQTQPSPTAQTPPDKTAPTLTVDGLTNTPVACELSYTPIATDDVRMQKVEYYIDNQLIYVSNAAPFALDASAEGLTDGDHTIRVVAYDQAANKTTRETTIAVQKTDDCKDETQVVTEESSTTASPGRTTARTATTTSQTQTTTGDQSSDDEQDDDPPPTPPDTEDPTAPSNLLVSFDGTAHFNELTWDAATDNVAVTQYKVYRDGTLLGTSATLRYFDMRISDGQSYEYQVFAADAANNVSDTGTNEVTILLAPQTVWTANPALTDSDGSGVEVGLRFSPRVAGKATGVRFYKGTGNGGTHNGTLWEYDYGGNTGTQIGTVTFTSETSSGWQTAYFSTPITLTAGDLYVVSYYAPQGHTSYTPQFFDTGHVTEYLESPAYDGVRATASYKIGAGFPDQPAGGTTGYAVDIAFAPDTPAAQAPINGTWSAKYAQWTNGPDFDDVSVFPTAIWTQWAGRLQGGTPNGTNYQNVGIKLDVGLEGWPSVSEIQLDDIVATNWRAFASPSTQDDHTPLDNVTTLQSDVRAPYVDGYILSDEPDMNQVNLGANSVLSPLSIEAFTAAVKTADPTRPTYINFGKPMAIDKWNGYTLIQTGSPESDYQHYCNGLDIASADYYGWSDPFEPANYHGAWTYGEALDNMRKHCDEETILWGFAEASMAWSGTNDKPTPTELEQAVWSMIVHGATGIHYFTQQFFGSFVEDAFLYDAPMRAKITQVNAALQTYAPQLNTKSTLYMAAGKTDESGVPLDTMTKQVSGSTYIFAQAGGSLTQPNSVNDVEGTIAVNTSATTAEVLGESRTVPIVDGRIVDNFDAYQVHIYQF